MVLGFVIFWVLLGLAVILIALRGGSKDPTPGESRAFERLTLIGIVVLFGFGIAVPALVMADNAKNKAASAPGGVTLTAAQQHGRYLFGEACAVCHTLRASNAVARTGPNLDVLRPPEALVLDAIANGRYRGQGRHAGAAVHRGRRAGGCQLRRRGRRALSSIRSAVGAGRITTQPLNLLLFRGGESGGPNCWGESSPMARSATLSARARQLTP